VTDLNPQREQMAHESMVRTLAAQFEAIWPQERPLVERHGLSGAVRVLDAGCGTGTIWRWRVPRRASASMPATGPSPSAVSATPIRAWPSPPAT